VNAIHLTHANLKWPLLVAVAGAVLLLSNCSSPNVPTFEPESVRPGIVSPPVMCAPDGSCPPGLMCANDNHCGEPCGVNFACDLGWYCYAFGPGHVNHDCAPACYFTDGGC
jgi:hypothetical protein